MREIKAKHQIPILICLLVVLFLGKVSLENYMGPGSPDVSVRRVVNHLSEGDPENATVMGIAVALGYEGVATDFLFLQLIQYFGDWKMRRGEKFKKVYPVLRAMNEISPNFVPAYSLGALALEELGYVNEAIHILNQGIINNPRAFELYLYRDLTLRLFKTREYGKAIEGIKMALKLEDYPPILERILAYAYEKNGQIDEAILQWKRIYTSTQDPRIRDICRKHLERLEQLRGEK